MRPSKQYADNPITTKTPEPEWGEKDYEDAMNLRAELGRATPTSRCNLTSDVPPGAIHLEKLGLLAISLPLCGV